MKQTWFGVAAAGSRRTLLLVLFLTISALALAACGANQGPGSSEYSQGVTDDTIKIGVYGPFSGNASVYSKAQHMAIAIYKDANENGGINGRQLEIVEADSACDPTTVQAIVRRFAEQDKVFMIHGGSCSNALIAARPVIESAGIPFLSMNAASNAISNPPIGNLFQPKPTVDEIGAAIVAFVESNPTVEDIGIIAQSDEWGQTSLQPVLDALEASDLNVVVNEQIDPETGDTTAQVRRLLQEEPDMAIVFAYPAPMSVFLRDAYAQGLEIPIVTGDGARPEEQIERIGAREPAEELFSAYTFTAPVDAPEFERYRELLAKHYPNDVFDAVALEGAISAEFNLEVLRNMGDELTWENWIATAETVEVTTAVGGEMQFQAFAPDEPRTRRPGMTVRFSALDPAQTGTKIVVITNWSDWEATAQ